MTKNDQRLSGTKEICQYCDRPWETIMTWVKESSFPVAKLAGRWESRKDLIDGWFIDQISSKNSRKRV